MVSLPGSKLVVLWLKKGNRVYEVHMSRVHCAILLGNDGGCFSPGSPLRDPKVKERLGHLKNEVLLNCLTCVILL